MAEEKHQNTHHVNRNLVVLLSLSIFVVISLLTFLIIKSSEENKQITKTKAYEEAQTTTQKPNPTIRERNIPEGGSLIPIPTSIALQRIEVGWPRSSIYESIPVSLNLRLGTEFEWLPCQSKSEDIDEFSYDVHFMNSSGQEIIRKDVGISKNWGTLGAKKIVYDEQFIGFPLEPAEWRYWVTCSSINYSFPDKRVLYGQSDIYHISLDEVIINTPVDKAKIDLEKENIKVSFTTSNDNFEYLYFDFLDLFKISGYKTDFSLFKWKSDLKVEAVYGIRKKYSYVITRKEILENTKKYREGGYRYQEINFNKEVELRVTLVGSLMGGISNRPNKTLIIFTSPLQPSPVPSIANIP